MVNIQEELRQLLERRNERYANGTATMKLIHDEGDFEPPCEWDCTGDVNYRETDDAPWLFGRCPVMHQEPPCLIPVREREAMLEDLVGLGWPRRYLDDSEWAGCKVERELRAVGHGSGLLLLGPTGTGKTSAAALLAMSRWPSQRWGYVYWPNLVAKLGDVGVSKVAQQRWLVIDDYGVGEIAPWKIGDVDALWEYRNARKLPTITTTNLTRAQLEQDPMARRWIDRWRQLMPAIVTVSGESQR